MQSGSPGIRLSPPLRLLGPIVGSILLQLHVEDVIAIELRRQISTVRQSLLKEQCQETYFDEQYIDHFSFSRPSPDRQFWSQRYFICEEHWAGPRQSAPIFFYCGNEAAVDTFVTHTGLMWENAPDFGALLIFAEASLPFAFGAVIMPSRFVYVLFFLVCVCSI